MAKYTTRLTGSFSQTLNSIHNGILNTSVSASHEESENFENNGIRCAVNVYERYSWMGKNRCSMSVTLFGCDGDIRLTAITSGGSQAMFFKINTIGEDAFLDTLISIVEKLKQQA